MSEDDPVEELRVARERRDRVEDELDAYDEAAVRTVADAHEEATTLLDRYAESATGTGDFESYVEFQNRFVGLVEDLDDDLPAREAFETAGERFEKRRLNESDFEAARETLEPAAEVAELLERREAATERYRSARHAVEARIEELDERIADLERVERLGEVDLDAPTERLRDPIEAYDAAVRDAFEAFRRSSSARDLFRWVETTGAYPLVEYRQPPPELREYVFERPAGEEPLATLLEYADYSPSKLDHYVEDPSALKTRVAVHRTYLERLDAKPLVVSWPPPPAGVLERLGEELVAVVGRFADEEPTALAREVRDLPRTEDYDRLREAALARTELDDDERDRLATGEVERERRAAEEERERAATALENL